MRELHTAVEIALAHIQAHPIPPITEPMGRYWKQPDRFKIEIDDTHALMDRQTFAALAEYSHTYPTGAYPGKMWKRCHEGEDGPRLKWYGNHVDPNMVSIHTRKILIV